MEAQRVVTVEVEKALQSQVGVSKAEFSILRTLGGAAEATLRVVDLGAALNWEKSRVSHLLTRMENRDLVERIEEGARGRRTAVTLSTHGHEVLKAASSTHEKTVRRIFIDRLTRDQAAAIRSWGEQTISAMSSAADPPST